jgi:hypothetical protein
MNAKIDNLIYYFTKIFDKNDLGGTGFSKIINKKALNINVNEFKKFLTHSEWVSPVDILIMSIHFIEKISKQTNLKDCNKFGILWIICLLSTKYVYSHDNDLSIVFLANLGGFQLEDYIYFEKIILKKLDWKLEISDSDYKRLSDISNQNITNTNQKCN